MSKKELFMYEVNINYLVSDRDIYTSESCLTFTETEIIIILDCCYSYGFKLTYDSDNNIILPETTCRNIVVIAQMENMSLLTNAGCKVQNNQQLVDNKTGKRGKL